MKFINQYLKESKNIIDLIDKDQILKLIGLIADVRAKNGRMFILGVEEVPGMHHMQLMILEKSVVSKRTLPRTMSQN